MPALPKLLVLLSFLLVCSNAFSQNFNGNNIELVFVEGGKFGMGCNDSLYGECQSDAMPYSMIEVDNFFISRYPVTVAQYKLFCEQTGHSMPQAPEWGWHDNHPIVNISWYDAVDYAFWAGGRLPTEAEWEYAAKGGVLSQNYLYAGSNNVNDVAWIATSTIDVGLKLPNELGIFDMTGNVKEWCFDWYASDYYSRSKKRNPTGPLRGSNKVIRGGGWNNNQDEQCLTTVSRAFSAPQMMHPAIGFRVVYDKLVTHKQILISSNVVPEVKPSNVRKLWGGSSASNEQSSR